MTRIKHNYRVMYTVFNRHDGDIVCEQETMDAVAVNSAWAQVAVVKSLRSDYPNENYRIIVHESIWYDSTSESSAVDEILTEEEN